MIAFIIVFVSSLSVYSEVLVSVEDGNRLSNLSPDVVGLVEPGEHPNYDVQLPGTLTNNTGITLGELLIQNPQNIFAFTTETLSGPRKLVGYFDPVLPATQVTWTTPYVWEPPTEYSSSATLSPPPISCEVTHTCPPPPCPPGCECGPHNPPPPPPTPVPEPGQWRNMLLSLAGLLFVGYLKVDGKKRK